MSRARDPLTTALRTALAICAGCGWLAASMVLLDNLTPAGSWPLAAGCLAWLVFGPLYEVELANLIARIPLVGRALSRGVWVLEVLPVFLLPTPIADALIFGSMVIAQGHLFLASEDDRNAARCLAAAPLVNVIALAYTRSIALLALLPVSALAAMIALVLLGGRTARRKVRRGAPLIEDRAAVGGRLAYALPLGLIGLSLAALLFLAFAKLFEEPEPSVPRPGGPMQRADEGKLPETDDGSSDGSGGVSPEMAFAGNSTTPFSEEVVLYVYPEEGAPPGPSVHLRDMVLDHFTQSSVRAANRRTPPLYLDEDDGRQDGWTEVARAGSDVDFETHRIRSRRLYLSAQSEWTLLFAPHPLAAIEIPRLHYHPDAVLFTPEVVDEWFDYRVRSAVVDTSPAALRGLSRSSSVSSQNTRLPVSSPALQAIADQAAEWTRSASSDYEIVAAIVGRLRSEFEYELRDLDFRGPDALLQFLEERKGYCTYFATAAAMMLRTRGIPARVATGFLAHEWVASEGRYVVREKDAHAWIEVAFDRVGWVTFDPTPAGAQEFGSELLAQEDLDSRPPFSERIRGAIEDWLSDDGSLGAVLATLLRWPAEVLRRYPALWLLPSGLFFLILHLLLRRRQRPRWDEGPLDLPRRTVGLFQRLAQTLAGLGHHRRPSQTPREFATALPASVAFAAVGEATELYYRARFGGAPLVASEEQFVEQVILDLGREHTPDDAPGAV